MDALPIVRNGRGPATRDRDPGRRPNFYHHPPPAKRPRVRGLVRRPRGLGTALGGRELAARVGKTDLVDVLRR